MKSVKVPYQELQCMFLLIHSTVCTHCFCKQRHWSDWVDVQANLGLCRGKLQWHIFTSWSIWVVPCDNGALQAVCKQGRPQFITVAQSNQDFGSLEGSSCFMLREKIACMVNKRMYRYTSNLYLCLGQWQNFFYQYIFLLPAGANSFL